MSVGLLMSPAYTQPLCMTVMSVQAMIRSICLSVCLSRISTICAQCVDGVRVRATPSAAPPTLFLHLTNPFRDIGMGKQTQSTGQSLVLAGWLVRWAGWC